MKETMALRITGVVQGVGFRPHVARLARQMKIDGFVRNAGGEVYIVARGQAPALNCFCNALKNHPPAGSLIRTIERMEHEASAPVPEGFSIEASEAAVGVAMPGPDIAMCEGCRTELFTPGNPRFHNPFISCTYCGPRFSILKALPYDRGNTSMEPFPLCPLCQQEYEEESDRRFHAQTVCCNACGPTLSGIARDGREETGDIALQRAVEALNSGGIVAIKGIGGYHLSCDAANAGAVKQLRALKGREEKPFAVMFASLDAIKAHCAISKEEEALLISPARPIVLLHRREGACPIAPGVYGASRYLGTFLPYTPLQHLLFEHTGPLVMTSANPSGLPIFYKDDTMRAYFEAHREIAYLLTHNRPIERMLDDSVVVVIGGRTQFVRRARGYVPLPAAQADHRGSVIALGPHQKSNITIFSKEQLYPGAELGDLETEEMLHAYRNTAEELQCLLQAEPTHAVCDLHPGYASTGYAESLGLPLLRVQHHFAHIASVLAEHGVTKPVIGVAFDGTGYGTDGTVWGGECLIASPRGFYRAGHLQPVAYLGGDSSIRQGWKSAACLLYGANLPQRDARGQLVEAALKKDVNAIRSSSMGRVFDAISALLGVCEDSRYEGQCAIELEAVAARYLGESLPFSYDIMEEEGRQVVGLAPTFRALLLEREKGVDTALLAHRFHMTVADLIKEMCMRLREKTGIGDVALSGGVFHNRILLERSLALLQEAGFRVLTNMAVPPGDGGASLGQAYIGAFYTNAPERCASGRGGEWKEEEAICVLRSLEN